MEKHSIVLAIESSCDDTACSVCMDGTILSNVISSQPVHEQFGGVVPELASRAHLHNIVPVIDAALKIADCELEGGKGGRRVNCISFTQSPGLIGSLLVGSQFAKSLASAMGIPLIGVNHMQAHVLANLIDDPKPDFPFLCLTVSGGHTQIVLCESPLQMKVIGETLDDAAGEAFDKTAKLLGLPYPGGPLIDRYAKAGDPNRFRFPEPQVPGLDFSFSGLKTSILYFLQEKMAADPGFIKENLQDICASVQGRIVSIMLNKLKKAAAQTGVKNICIAGGVSANSGLRKAFEETGKLNGWNIYIPKMEYCTDNAAMIAITGYFKFLAGDFTPLYSSASAISDW
jgi:N6-L-threonylcarbamoyladenine synthase